MLLSVQKPPDQLLQSQEHLHTSTFYDEMDALMSLWALANTFDALEVVGGRLQD